MRTLTMTEFRSSPGERLIDVLRNREQFLLTKAGKPAAMLVPIGDADVTTVIERDGTIRGPTPLTYKFPLV
jgi:antitoxin (DNA-binding transcriptional repressor) of toxin-antitoxin stability system